MKQSLRNKRQAAAARKTAPKSGAPRGGRAQTATRSAKGRDSINESLQRGLESALGQVDAMAEMKAEDVALCRNFQTPGGCSYGAKCRFRHEHKVEAEVKTDATEPKPVTEAKEQEPEAPPAQLHEMENDDEEFVVQTKVESRSKWTGLAMGLAVFGGLAIAQFVRGRKVTLLKNAVVAAGMHAATQAFVGLIDRRWRDWVPLSSLVEPATAPPLIIRSAETRQPQARSSKAVILGAADSLVQTSLVWLGRRDYRETALVRVREFNPDIANRKVDARLTNLRANPAVPDAVTVREAQITPVDGSHSTFCFYSPEIANQVLTRLYVTKPSDRPLVAVDFASRVTNLSLPGWCAPDVYRGSGLVACLKATTHDVSSEHVLKHISFLGDRGCAHFFMGLVIASAMASPLVRVLTTALKCAGLETFRRYNPVALSKWAWASFYPG